MSRPTLLWLRRGTARVRAGEGSHDVRAEQALWVPADVPCSWDLGSGSLLVPIAFPVASTTSAACSVTVLTVPPGWQDWLVHRLACALHWGYRGEHTGDAVLEWLASASPPASGSRPTAPSGLPRSEAARAVVERLLDGDLARPLADLASAVGASARTVQRQLADETGATFSQWRRRARVVVAMNHVADGATVTWAAHQVGYATTSALTRAFIAETGRPPSTFAHRDGHDTHRETRASPTPRPGPAPEPPPIPAVPAMESIDDFDLAVWAYRGRARVRVGEREAVLETGDVVWLPAGTPNSISIEAGGVLLPLGYRLGFRTRDRYVLQVLTTGPEHEDGLLATVVANYTDAGGEDADPEIIVEQVEAAHRRATRADHDEMPQAVRHLMAALARDPANPRSLSVFARELDMDRAELARQFRESVDQSFPAWRARLRMTVARNMLWEGLTPSTTARHLGYAHLSGFSRLFTAANGITPREFVRTQVETY